MVSNSAKLDSTTKQHTQFGVSASNCSRDMAWTKVAEKKRKKNERGRNYIASPTGIANNQLTEGQGQNSQAKAGVTLGHFWQTLSILLARLFLKLFAAPHLDGEQLVKPGANLNFVNKQDGCPRCEYLLGTCRPSS